MALSGPRANCKSVPKDAWLGSLLLLLQSTDNADDILSLCGWLGGSVDTMQDLCTVGKGDNRRGPTLTNRDVSFQIFF